MILFLLLLGCAGMSYVQAEEYSGTCGAAGNEANVTWELDTESGSLWIRGTGAMYPWTDLNAIPWFSRREYVQQVYVTAGVTNTGLHGFYGCYNLTYASLPSTLTELGWMAFFGCSQLTYLDIPTSVATIGGRALEGCSSLTHVFASWTDNIPTMPSNLHTYPASKIKLHIPCGTTAAYTAKGWNTLFTLDEALDAGTCGKAGYDLTWQIECDSVITVSGTGKMKDYPVPQYMTIAGFRFTMNGGLLSPFYSEASVERGAVFEEGVTYIGNNTFYKGTYHSGYPYLTTLILPSTLTEISSTAFRGLVALSDVYVSWTTAASIPAWNNSVNVSQATLHVPCGTKSLYQAKSGWNGFNIVEDRAFGLCGATGHNLVWSLSCDGTLTISGSGAMADWSSSDKVPWYSYRSSITTVNIRDGVTSVGNRAFIECTALTSVTIPNSVTSISNNAFFSCSALANITIPNSVTTIGQYVFYGCSALTNITIPGSVTSLGENTFRNCSALTDIYVSWISSIPTWPTGFTNKSPQSDITLHVPCGTGDVYAAQDGWKDYTIVANLPRVLSGTCGATGNEANVTWSLDLCDSTLTISGTGPMTDFDYKGAPWYPYRQSITSITIANGVTSIGEWAFYGCTNLTSVTIPSNVTNIGGSAFYYCISLTSITIPNSVINISDFAFYHCTALSSVSIPNSVTSIGIMAFDSCTGLTSITIPNSITSIGEYAFYTCSSLTDIYVSWTSSETIPTWYYMTDNDPPTSVTLHVPCAAMSLYQAAEGWKDYTIEGEGGPYTITVESDDLSMGTVDARKIEN